MKNAPLKEIGLTISSVEMTAGDLISLSINSISNLVPATDNSLRFTKRPVNVYLNKAYMNNFEQVRSIIIESGKTSKLSDDKPKYKLGQRVMLEKFIRRMISSRSGR